MGWQMLGTFLEAMTQGQGLLMCPLMEHMAGHCRRSALCVYTVVPLCQTSCSTELTLQPLQQHCVTFAAIVSQYMTFKNFKLK